jgi:hypothetical protein
MEKSKNKKQVYWKICCSLAIFISLLTFTPLVMPHGIINPQIFSLPYTFWTGIIIAVALVTLTYIGARVHPKE